MLCEAKSKERSLNLLCELNLEIEARVRESHTQNLFKGSSYVEIRSERFSFCDLCHSHLSLSLFSQCRVKRFGSFKSIR